MTLNFNFTEGYETDMNQAQVLMVIGSDSDLPVMREAAEMLDKLV